MLEERYYTKRAHCNICLETALGFPLSSFFILDREGDFCCMNCDDDFEEGDERIWEPGVDK